MPSGKTHDRITYLAAVPAGIGLYAALGTWEPAVCVAGGILFGGLMFGPDLDVKSVQYYRWGPLRWVWWPYQRMFRHRSPWTHSLAWGLLVRLVYLTAVIGILGALAFALIHTYVTPLSWTLTPQSMLGPLDEPATRRAGWALLGTWVGGALHTLADVTVSAVKRRGRPLRSGR